MQNEEYNDDYPTCEEVHATLRVITPQGDFGRVSELLNISPTSISERDMTKQRPGTWFLESEGKTKSLDSRKHIDWILGQVSSKKREIELLNNEGYEIDLTCFWVSLSGHGGPTLSPKQMKVLSELDISIWYDVYMGGDE